MNPTSALVNVLKDSGEDFEFYPTTDEIISSMVADIKDAVDSFHEYCSHFRIGSVLDIGAGNGKVLKAFQKNIEGCELYAIEKSLNLCNQLSGFAFVIGTDFQEQSLLSKQIDLTFCNPPYSEFEDWAVKIIRESASRIIYLVIPMRWTNSVRIADALKYRNAKYSIVGEFSFEDSEDRKARAVVNLIRIVMQEDKDDAFDRFFDEQFSHLRARYEEANKEKIKEKKDVKFDYLIAGENLVEMLVEMYDKEMDHVRKNYETAGKLDVELLRELHVTPNNILACLKERLSGLKLKYWNELFSHMQAVTNRLTAKKRNMLLGTLNRNGHVDFTTNNTYAVLLWILKNANGYIDEQLMEVFDMMISKANVHNYKSNQRVFTYDRWRYNEEKPTHIALEYRLVMDRAGGIRRSNFSFETGLEDRAADFIGDILTVAYNLGFNCNTVAPQLNDRRSWRSGERHVFDCTYEGKKMELLEVRAFLNGNMHIRLNQKFALALNVENGRLRGWIKSGQQAVEELDDKEAVKYFGTAFQLGATSLPMLMACNK